MNFKIHSELRIQNARTALLLDHPFFGTLLFRFGARASSSIASMATNGVSHFYNPDFADMQNSAELAGVLAHEAMQSRFTAPYPARCPAAGILEHGLRRRHRSDSPPRQDA
jgi:Putative metallopeptidase domain